MAGCLHGLALMKLSIVLESILLHKIEVALARFYYHVIVNDIKDSYRKKLAKAG